MTRGAKAAIGLGFILLITLAIVGLFLHNLVTKSWPQTSGKITLSGLHNPADIYRDEYGVPHINAGDEHDLMFCMGYVHAQDRLWQMELARRAGEGRLSEILDTAGTEFDILFRTLGFNTVADSLYKYINPTSKKLLEDYSEGVNEFIRTQKGRYPIEFDMTDCEPELWKPEHSLIVMRLLAWELSFAWWVDLNYGRIQPLVTQEKFNELISLNNDTKSKKSVSEIFSKVNIRKFCETVRKYRQRFGNEGFSSGSNAWVVDGSKSASGKPILANDPHLIITLPSQWYEVHLSAPGWNVYGVTLPGVPLVAIGHNDSLAWGFTNAMLDDADFYVEQEDTLKPDRYIYNNKSFPMGMRNEKIYIGHRDSLELAVRRTHHGVIVSDIHPGLKHDSVGDIWRKQPISLRWTGFEMSDEILGFYKINRAVDAAEFEDGLKELAVPAQCAVYADARGNIGWWMAGLVPDRGKKTGVLPLKGWTKDDEWSGYFAFDKLPHGWNPKEGYIAFANQEFGGEVFPYYLSALWEPTDRYDRIKELLSQEKLSPQDFEQFQQDVVSRYEKFLAEEILKEFSDESSESPIVRNALVYLRSWNYRCSTDDIASSMVNVFFVKLVQNIFLDEMGEDLFHDFVYYPISAYRITERLLKNGQSQWFDDVRTDSVEMKSEIVRKSFLEALGELEKDFGSEMKAWQWGKLHQVLYKHPFSVKKPLDRIFNVGPFPASGSGQTINKGAFQLTDPYFVFACPSMRQIVDMADLKTARMVNNLGQSGQPLNPHYSDQSSLWLNGGYRITTTDWDVIRKQNWDHLTLIPN
jgi:penicillin G amidase